MSYLFLNSTQEKLIDQIINVGMMGVYKDIGDTFMMDDEYVFEVVQFRGTNDFNLNFLLEVHDQLQESMDSIMSENDIRDDELLEVLPDYIEIYEPDYMGFDLDDEDFDDDSFE
ncbi:MAG TPA: hypothetical protein VKX34_03505 [Aequorivita sp.]|nr:hypothetical protein [Aequorivita sp.]